MAADGPGGKDELKATRRASGAGRTLAASLPRLILESRKIAATVIHGLHGRKRSGSGENFWQFRRFVSGEEARRIDWRRSARDDNLYVREREWEAAHTIWLWPDRSPSMAFTSRLARESKLDRTLTIAFALGEILVEAGERVGLPGLMRPTGSRAVLTQLSSNGSQGHLVQIVDPAEETFPYSGRIEFTEPEGAGEVTAGRAENWRADYEARLKRHRDEIRAEAARLGWSFTIHRTDRPANELLMGLHARIGEGN